MFDLRKEASADFAVGGEAHAAAGSAECLADRRDDADFADAVGKSIAAGRFAGLRVAAMSHERHIATDAGDDLGSGTTISGVQRRPSSRGMNSMKRTTTSSSRAKRAKPSIWSSLKPRSSTQLIFERGQAGGARGADAGKNLVKAAGNAGDALEGWRVDGIHAHGDAIQPRGFERGGQRCRAGGHWW